MISWQSRKQSSIALSTMEAEYIASCSASCEAIWLRKLLTGLFDLEMRATEILCDNQRCIKMTENPRVPRQVEAHRDPLSFHPRHGTERSLEAPVH
jgi:hypothetical protein